MTQSSDRQKLNTDQIELHLKSAVDTLTPNVFDRIDLTTPQDLPVPSVLQARDDHLLPLPRRMRGMVLAAAACFCLVLTGGGAYHYQYQNRQVDSVIGIDVNPSVELSINRKNRVLSAEPLNEDARDILEDMDLEGVDLNVAVNAVIGSMVAHGYLDDLENAILVTVSNDSIKKATELRASVVGDIEQTLVENQVQAVVYDQQVIEKDEMKEIAGKYGISYGKAYFLMELIDQNQELTMDDMEELSSLTMEEIAGRITENSLALGEFADKAEESTEAPSSEPAATQAATAEETTEAATEESTTQAETTAEETTQASTAETTEEEQEDVKEERVKIDYAEYEDGMVYVYFVTYVKWKNPTVSVRDEEGNSYAALVEDTSSDECTISVHGLQGGKSYTFVLGGLTPKEGGNATTVTGYFEKPEIAGEATEPEDDETEESETSSAGKEESTGEAGSTEESTGNPAGESTQDSTEAGAGSDPADPSETAAKEETASEEESSVEEPSDSKTSAEDHPEKASYIPEQDGESAAG